MTFKDMDESSPYLREVSLVVEHGLMSGMADGRFEPDTPISTALFIMSIWDIFGCGKGSEPKWDADNLRDSERTHWMGIYISSCRSHGIDYSAELTPDSQLSIAEAQDILDSLTRALSAQFNLELHCSHAKFFRRYPDNSTDTKVTRLKAACLLYWFCQSIGNQILGHQTHVLDGKLFIATDSARFFLAFVNTNCDLIQLIDFLSHHQNTTPDTLKALIHIMECKKRVLLSLLFKGPGVLYHYTTLSALSNLAPNTFGFRLSNAAFLNDPSEGKLLIQKFENDIASKLPYSYSSNFISPIQTYLASFNPTDDSLPMWVQYGDKSAGCSIGFDPNAFLQPVYRVSYDFNDFKPFFSRVNKELSKLLSLKPVEAYAYQIRVLYLYAMTCLNELAYLYKDEHYNHESELRIIITRHPKFAEKEPTPRSGEIFPRTFVSVPYRILSVTFGVNAPDPKKLAVGLASVGLNCRFKHSAIPFQN